MQLRHILANIMIALFIFGLVVVISHMLWILGIILKTKETILIAALLAIVISAFIILKCPPTIKKYVLFVAYLFICIEVFLQAIAFFGLLPSVSFFYHLPYGRVYYSKEGLGNSIMNEYGWYYPSFELNAESKKIVLIGDSYIQAVQIAPNQNIGIALQDFLNLSNQENSKTQVLSLGLSGIGPAEYLEILAYSHKHFDPSAAVIFIFLGNDFRNTFSEIQANLHPETHIYYQMDENGEIYLNPDSTPALVEFRKQLQENHNPSIYTMSKTLCSYMILPQVSKTFVKSVQNILKHGSSDNSAKLKDIHRDLQYIGIDDFIFKTPVTSHAKRAFKVTTELLLKSHQYAKAHDIELLFVTVPIFPGQFYEIHDPNTKTWNLKLGEYDFLLPENMLADFAREKRIHILPMGQYIKKKELNPREIRRLYMNGTGHWSVMGHKFFAEAVYSYLTANNDDLLSAATM